MVTPQARPGAPVVTVHDLNRTLTGPLLGCARYADGSLILITEHVLPTHPDTTMTTVYRTHGPDPRWQTVWTMPDRLVNFICTQPIGTTGKVSNRNIEVMDVTGVAPTGHITIARDPGLDHWVGY